MPLNYENAIKAIALIVLAELEKKTVSSQSRLGYLMQVSQGTISKLVQPEKFNNIPDINTLEAIAIYRNQKLWEFIKELEEEKAIALTPEQIKNQAIAKILEIDDPKLLAEVNMMLANHLSYQLLLQEKNHR